MRRKLLTTLTVLGVIVFGALVLTGVVYVIGCMLGDLLAFCFIFWALLA